MTFLTMAMTLIEICYDILSYGYDLQCYDLLHYGYDLPRDTL